MSRLGCGHNNRDSVDTDLLQSPPLGSPVLKPRLDLKQNTQLSLIGLHFYDGQESD